MTAVTHFIAYVKGFFRFPFGTGKSGSLVTGKLLISAFLLYFLISMLLAPFAVRITLRIVQILRPESTGLSIVEISALQLALMLFTLILFLLLLNPRLPGIWKEQYKTSTIFDLGLGASTWLLSFPLVTVIGNICDWILTHFFHVKYYEQGAVNFLKRTTEVSQALLLGLLAVVILAPLIEEILFRRLLQSYLKSKLGTKAAILLTSGTFAGFHFSTNQGFGNISLSISLFILGIYLGFLYERQRSLFASLGLHVTFNAVSAFRILFFPETI